MRRSTARSAELGESRGVGYAVVVIGASWGGLDALRAVVSGLPPEYSLPTTIVEHRHRDSDAMLVRVLQDVTRLRVCEVEDKRSIEWGTVFVAPANYHALVGHGHFDLSVDAPVGYSRPSIDVAMISAADAYGHRAVGVILTGSNADGARGLRRIADAGGLAVVQDPATAEYREMPAAALKAVPTARVFALDRIGTFLGSLPTSRGRGRRQSRKTA